MSTQLILNETATREVEQDTLVAIVGAHGQSDDAREAQAMVNGAMTAAVEKARQVAGVRPTTRGYRVYRRHDRDGKPQDWIAEQDLLLDSEEAAPLLELVGELQTDGLILKQLSYRLSAKVRRTVEDELTIEAIQRLRERAEEVASSVDMNVATIAVLQVGEAPQVRPMMRSNAMADVAGASAAPPVALPDLQTVSATVRAEFTLAPR